MREQIAEQYKKVETEVRENAHRAWLFSLGTFSWVEEGSKGLVEDGRKLVADLVERGKKLESRGKKEIEKAKKEAGKEAKNLRQRVEQGFEEVGEKVDQQLTEVLHRVGIPTREEIRTLTRRVEELTARLEGQLAEGKTEKKTAAAKSAAN